MDSLEDVIDPALMNGDASQLSQEAIEDDPHTPGPFNDDIEAESAGRQLNDMTDSHSRSDDQVLLIDSTEDAAADLAIQSPDIKMEHDHNEYHTSNEGPERFSTAVKANGVFATPGSAKAGSSVNGDYSGTLNSGLRSRHSSRQPKQTERYSPEDNRSPSKTHPKPSESQRRASSAASAQTTATSVKRRRSSSNTSGTIHQMASMAGMAGIKVGRSPFPDASARPVSRDSGSDLGADEQFARQLQAAENGLRRRTSMRA
jgi:hypothetical protein